MRIMQWILLLTSIFTVSTVSALAIPAKPEGYVSDYANVLLPADVVLLNDKLQQFEQQTTNQIFVAIFPSLENEEISDFTTRLEDQWKIGQKGKDNGILMVIFIKEHQVRIEVGYGLESKVPDAVAMQIIQNDIVPNFKTKDYYPGIDKSITALMQAIEQSSVVPNQELQSEQKPDSPPAWHQSLAIIVLIAVLIWKTIHTYRATTPKLDPNLPLWKKILIRIYRVFKFLFIFLCSFFLLVFYVIALIGIGGGSSKGGASGGGGRSGGGGANGRW